MAKVDTELAQAARQLRAIITGYIPWLNSQVTHIVHDWESVEIRYYDAPPSEGGQYVGFKSFDRDEVLRLVGLGI